MMTRVGTSIRIIAASAVIIAAPLTAHFEGLRLKSYLDPVNIPTICYGETEGVKMGMVKTKAECDSMLSSKLYVISLSVQREAGVPMSPKMVAALSSWVYNVGETSAYKSTLMRLLKAGKYKEACNQLPRWNMAGGRVLNGLVYRREQERKLCLEGINDIVN